jgi:hypothetical protein
MNKHVRRGLISVAVAAVSLAAAVLPGRAGATIPPSTPVYWYAPAQPTQQPTSSPKVAATVVCDEGVPNPDACRVPVKISTVGAQGTKLEATTYDRTAIADKDYVAFVRLPIEETDAAGDTTVYVTLLDDRECELPEEFLVVVTGPELPVIIPVLIKDSGC